MFPVRLPKKVKKLIIVMDNGEAYCLNDPAGEQVSIHSSTRGYDPVTEMDIIETSIDLRVTTTKLDKVYDPEGIIVGKLGEGMQQVKELGDGKTTIQ